MWERWRAAPAPGRVIRSWEHNTWGDNLQLLSPSQIAGWMEKFPDRNDHILIRRAAGVARFRVMRVNPCGDPRDMFFADIRFLRIES